LFKFFVIAAIHGIEQKNTIVETSQAGERNGGHLKKLSLGQAH